MKKDDVKKAKDEYWARFVDQVIEASKDDKAASVMFNDKEFREWVERFMGNKKKVFDRGKKLEAADMFNDLRDGIVRKAKSWNQRRTASLHPGWNKIPRDLVRLIRSLLLTKLQTSVKDPDEKEIDELFRAIDKTNPETGFQDVPEVAQLLREFYKKEGARAEEKDAPPPPPPPPPRKERPSPNTGEQKKAEPLKTQGPKKPYVPPPKFDIDRTKFIPKQFPEKQIPTKKWKPVKVWKKVRTNEGCEKKPHWSRESEQTGDPKGVPLRPPNCPPRPTQPTFGPPRPPPQPPRDDPPPPPPPPPNNGGNNPPQNPPDGPPGPPGGPPPPPPPPVPDIVLPPNAHWWQGIGDRVPFVYNDEVKIYSRENLTKASGWDKIRNWGRIYLVLQPHTLETLRGLKSNMTIWCHKEKLRDTVTYADDFLSVMMEIWLHGDIMPIRENKLKQDIYNAVFDGKEPRFMHWFRKNHPNFHSFVFDPMEYIFGFGTRKPSKEEPKCFVETFCRGFIPIDSVADGAWLRIPMDLAKKADKIRGCGCKTQKYSIGLSVKCCTPYIHNDCFHSDVNALVTRQFLKRSYQKGSWTDAFRCFNGIFGRYLQREILFGKKPEFDAMDVDEILRDRTTNQRDAYKKAHANFQKTGCYPPRTRVDAFTKREFLYKTPADHKPRMISGHHPEYFMEIGPLGLSLQKYVTQIGMDLHSPFVYTGGYTGEQIGSLVNKMENMGKIAYEWDHSKFDASISDEGLKELYLCIKNLFDTVTEFCTPGKNAHLTNKWLNELDMWLGAMNDTIKYEAQFKNSGVTGGRDGSVHSGHWCTSWGNSMLNLASMVFALTEAGLEEAYILDQVIAVLGDDGMLFLEDRLTEKQLLKISKILGDLGFNDKGKTTELKESADYDHLEFCSSLFWRVEGTRVLGPKPFRWLGKVFHTKRNWSAEETLAIMRGIVLDKTRWFIPVIGEICMWLESSISSGHVIREKEFKSYSIGVEHIRDQATMDHFYNYYGMVPQQLKDFVTTLPSFELGVVLASPFLELGSSIDDILTGNALQLWCEDVNNWTDDWSAVHSYAQVLGKKLTIT